MFPIKIITVLVFITSNTLAQRNYELMYVKGSYDEILKESNSLKDTADYYWNSLVYDKQGKTFKSISVINEGLEKYPGNKILEKQLADYLYRTGQFSKARPLLTKYSKSPEMFVKLVKTLGFENEYQTAISLILERTVLDSANIEYLSLLGDYYYHIDSLFASIKVSEKLLILNPNDQGNLKKLANMYIKIKDYEKAIKVCDIVLVNDSTNKMFTRIKGIASFNNSDFVVAVECFKSLIEQGDSGKFVLKHLGICEFKNDLFEESRSHLLLAFEKDSNDFNICFFLGRAFLYSSSPEDGLYYLDRVDSLLQPDPKTISAIYFYKQEIYNAIGRFEDALINYQAAYKYNPNPEYIFYIASLHQYKLDNKNKAIEYYERFLSLLPSKPELKNIEDNRQITVSLKEAAEANIKYLKEQLFLKGKLN